MTKITTTLAVLLVFALAGCDPVTPDHLRSQSNLEAGLQGLTDARSAAVAGMQAKGPPDPDITDAPAPVTSLRAARVALAEDAGRDLAMATGPKSPGQASDRISMLFRAAVKSWYAGREARGDTVLKIAKAGEGVCGADGLSRAPRDCQIILLAPRLTAMQSSADVIFDTEIDFAARLGRGERVLPAADLSALVRAVTDLARRSQELDAAKRDGLPGGHAMRADIVSLVEDFQVQSWCHAVVAVTLMPNAQTAGGVGVGLAARSLLTGGEPVASPELSSVLEAADVSATAAAGLYRAYSRSMLALARPGQTPRNDVPTHRAICDLSGLPS